MPKAPLVEMHENGGRVTESSFINSAVHLEIEAKCS